MIVTFLDHSAVVKRETSLDQYLFEDEVSFNDKIGEALDEIIQILKNNSRKVRLYCTPLVLQESEAQTTSKNGESFTDTIERMMWVVKSTANSGNSVFTLYGSNDDSTFYEIDTIVTAEIGTFNLKFRTPYKYYRIDWAGTTCTYESYLVESNFYLSHLYKTLEIIYRALQNESPMYKDKADFYMNKFDVAMDAMVTSYDADDDGEVEIGEEDDKLQARLFR